MSHLIEVNRFTREYFEILSETFEQVLGIYLDRGTSLFETLVPITAEIASRPVSQDCASLAAQVKHVCFYLEVLEGHMTQKPLENVDWQEIWRTTREVTPEEWQAIKDKLKETYQRVLALMKSFDTWEG